MSRFELQLQVFSISVIVRNHSQGVSRTNGFKGFFEVTESIFDEEVYMPERLEDRYLLDLSFQKFCFIRELLGLRIAWNRYLMLEQNTELKC